MHHTLNIAVWHSLTATGILATTEPAWHIHLDGKHPDGLTLIQWCNGWVLTWDLTVASILANSYISWTAHSADAATESAAIRKSPSMKNCCTLTSSNWKLAASWILQPWTSFLNRLQNFQGNQRDWAVHVSFSFPAHFHRQSLNSTFQFQSLYQVSPASKITLSENTYKRFGSATYN